MIARQIIENRCEVEVEYSRLVNREGNKKSQALNDIYFERRESFRWRGIGDIPKSALKLKDEFADLDAEIIYQDKLPTDAIDDYKACLCGTILRGAAKPDQCKVFGKACTPSNPLGSCMVSSEGACSAYYKYGHLL